MRENESHIGDLVLIRKGKKPNSLFESYMTNSKRFIQIEDLRSDKKIQYTDDTNGVEVNPNDLCIVWDGANAGTTGYGLEGYIGSTIARLRLKNSEHVFTPYLGRFLQAKFQELRSNTTGATIPHLRKDHLTGLDIFLPKRSEQKKIATVLDKADQLRQKRKKTIEKLDQLIQSVFLDMFGDPVTNPKGWEVVAFEKCFNGIKYGTSTPPKYVDEGIPFIRATNIKKGGVVRNDLKFITQIEAKNIKKCKLKYGDLLVVRSGVNSGDAAFINEEYSGTYAGYDLIVDIEPELSIFYNYFINSPQGKYVIKPMTRRAGQPHLNADQMKNMKVIKPPIELIREYIKKFDVINKIKGQNQIIIKNSDELFNSLLQQAFKGELKFNDKVFMELEEEVMN